MTIKQFILVIRGLPSDGPHIDPSKWYATQKEHWLGWLSEYHSPGAYGRKSHSRRDARYAYNHIVEAKMLLWLVQAAGVRMWNLSVLLDALVQKLPHSNRNPQRYENIFLGMSFKRRYGQKRMYRV